MAAAALTLPGGPPLGRTVVMGVVNVTPDSFSDGGRYLDTRAAIAHGEQLHAEGADLIDVGGESTRPGAERVDSDSEIARVVPVIKALAQQGIATTIDTMRAEVARAALKAGCRGINDVSGGLADRQMYSVAAQTGSPIILMHWRAHSAVMKDFAHYADVVTDVRDELLDRVDAALAAGVLHDQIVIDPGLGFAKTAQHNWTLLRNLTSLMDAGLPVLVAASRKSFLGSLLAAADSTPRPASEREDATTAISALCAAAGVWGVRVHSVRATLDAVKVAAAWTGEQ
ncbi:MAG: dihydropteroate synthase [Antricoccus sp.]